MRNVSKLKTILKESVFYALKSILLESHVIIIDYYYYVIIIDHVTHFISHTTVYRTLNVK